MDDTTLLRFVVYASAVEVALGAVGTLGFINNVLYPEPAAFSVLVIGVGLVTGAAAYVRLRTGV